LVVILPNVSFTAIKNILEMYNTKDTAKETYLPERSKGCDLRSPG
jgi:hypothetical protein